VLDTIMSINACVIKGNREDYILSSLECNDNEWRAYKQFASIVWTSDQLTSRHIEYLRSLPEQAKLSYQGFDEIRVVHGSPNHIYEHLSLDQPEHIRDVLASINESVLVCAHTHTQFSKIIDGKLIINPGSTGVPCNECGEAEFALLNWDGDCWNASLEKIPFDIDRLEMDFELSGLLEVGGIWPRLLLDGIKSGQNHTFEFVKKAIRNRNEKAYSDSRFIPNSIWEKTKNEWLSKR